MAREKKWVDIPESSLRKKDQEEKGESWKSPSDRVSYIKRGVIKMFIPDEGKNRVRIVQCLEAANLEFYGLEVHFHRNVGSDNGDYLCLKRMYHVLKKAYGDDIEIGKVCSECEKQTSELWDTNPDLAKLYYPTRRMWFLVQNLLGEDPNEVLLWSCPWTLHEEILARSNMEESSVYINVAHPTTGVPISFERTGKGVTDTKYRNVQVFTSAMPLSNDILDQLPWLDEMLIIPTYDEVKAAADGVEVSRPTKPDTPTDTSTSTHTGYGGTTETSTPSREPEEDKPDDCFQKEYGTYQDCDDGTCRFAEECKNPPPPPPPVEEKPKKPSRKSRAEVKTEEAPPPAANGNSSKKEEIANKIKNAQARRRKEAGGE